MSETVSDTFTDIKDLGPEMFATGDGTVISWKGDSFYKACDVEVEKFPEGGTSHCVKRVNHKSWDHEDYEGRTRDRNFGEAVTIDWQVRNLVQKIFLRTGLDDEQVYNALNALYFAGINLTKEP